MEWEIGKGTVWDSFTDKIAVTVNEYVLYGIEQCDNVTKKQLQRQFLRNIAKHYGANLYFYDEPQEKRSFP